MFFTFLKLYRVLLKLLETSFTEHNLFKQDLNSLQIVNEYWSWQNSTSDLDF